MSKTRLKPYIQTLPNGFSFEMLPIEAGSFMMGDDSYWEIKPAHRINIDYNFLIGKYPVTQDLWKAVMTAENPSFFKGERRPVERISWLDAIVFCNAINEMCGYEPCYFADPGFQYPCGRANNGFILHFDHLVYQKKGNSCYRLPTEAEWEYAARGKSGTTDKPTKYIGSNQLNEVGWFMDNSHEETKPVGLKLSNEFGICDMSGNVGEWCEDEWNSGYEGAPDDGSAWGNSTTLVSHVYRGGSWLSSSVYATITSRNKDTSMSRSNDIGFRLVLSALPV